MTGVARDELEITDLLFRWGQARDSDDWQTLAACFHDDATIQISWMSGSARDFLEGSKNMAATRPAGAHVKHVFTGPWIKVRGNRAFSRCHANLYARARIDGYEFDFESFFRFFDLLEKRDGIWRLFNRVGVYEKDTMTPVEPGGVPASYLADMDLSAFQTETRFLSYRQSRTGVPTTPNMITVYSPEEAALKDHHEAWLTEG